MKRLIFFFLAGITGTCVGCSSGSNSNDIVQADIGNPVPSETNQSFLLGRSWLLESYTSESGELTIAAADVPYTFRFTFIDQGTLDGFGGFDDCNAFGTAGILLQENLITPVNGINVDTGSCDNRLLGVNANQGQFFFSVISNTFSYQTANSQLVLKSQSGKLLTFSQCELIDTVSIDSICVASVTNNQIAAPQRPPDGEAILFNELESGDSPPVAELDEAATRRLVVYKDVDSFQSDYEELYALADSQSMTAPAVDFSDTDVIGLFNGFEEAVGFKIEVIDIEQRGDQRVVSVRVTEPGRGCGFQPFRNDHYQFVTLPASNDDTIFTVVEQQSLACLSDFSVGLAMGINVVSDTVVELDWTNFIADAPVTEFSVSGDPLSQTVVSEPRITITDMLPGAYQQISIAAVLPDGSSTSPVTIRVNTNAKSGLRTRDINFQNLPIVARGFANPMARDCPVTISFVDTTATDQCVTSSYETSTPFTASYIFSGVDSYLATAIAITEKEETVLMSASNTLGLTEYSVFRCPTPIFQNGRLVCSECRDSIESRCNGFTP